MRRHQKPLFGGYVILLALSCAISSTAQAQFRPTQTNPGILTPAPAEITPDDLSGQRNPVPEHKDGEPAKLDVPLPPADQHATLLTFILRDIHVEDSTIFSQKDFAPLIAPYLNRKITFQDMDKLTGAINDLYRDKGYLTSRAYVPPQVIENNALTIRVREGRVGQISISGNRSFRAGLIASRLATEPGQLLNIPKLEKDLNLNNRLNPYRIKATLAAGSKPGETDIKLDVLEKLPWQVATTFDDQGRPTIGTYRWGTELSNQSLTGHADQLSIHQLSSAGTEVVVASYALPLNASGTEIGGTFAYSGVNVDLNTPHPPKVTGKAFNYGLSLSQPLDRQRVWVADAGMNLRNIYSYVDHTLNSEDDIRSLQVGLNYDRYDRWGRTFIRGQSTLAPAWMGANRTFWKTESYLTRLIVLPANNLLIIRGAAQFTPDALPSAEQFQVGGAFSVRGFTEGLLTGDRGYSFGVEHRWPIPGLKKVNPWLAERVQGASFFDMGQTWLDRSNQRFIGGVSNRPDRTLLIGAGAGLRIQLTRLAQGFVDFGFGLTDQHHVETNAQPSFRVHFGLRSNLLPEDYKTRSQDTTVLKSPQK